MATYYFAYGADMDSAELDLQHDRRRRPRLNFAKSIPATLDGYQLVCDIVSKHRRGGILNVVPAPKAVVHGVLYELHPGDTVSIAAMKEGEVAKYVLSVLPVKTRKGEMVPALVLRAEAAKKSLPASTAYLSIVVKAARDHGLPSEWIQELRTLPTV